MGGNLQQLVALVEEGAVGVAPHVLLTGAVDGWMLYGPKPCKIYQNMQRKTNTQKKERFFFLTSSFCLILTDSD